jgi:hypothetical protein
MIRNHPFTIRHISSCVGLGLGADVRTARRLADGRRAAGQGAGVPVAAMARGTRGMAGALRPTRQVRDDGPALVTPESRGSFFHRGKEGEGGQPFA